MTFQEDNIYWEQNLVCKVCKKKVGIEDTDRHEHNVFINFDDTKRWL
jgi:hypothetical protein